MAVVVGPTKRGALLIVLALAAGLLLWGAVSVDDWDRDFTTNFAETSADATDPLLRPILTTQPLPDVVETVKQVGGALPRWVFADEGSVDGGVVLRFVRATRVFRFKDDVTVYVTDQQDRRLVSATSRSRVGKGDLGQNPRNLRQLFRALGKRLR